MDVEHSKLKSAYDITREEELGSTDKVLNSIQEDAEATLIQSDEPSSTADTSQEPQE